jgi:fucose permease
MQTLIAFALILTACLMVFFLVPHHRKRPVSFQARTLWQIYYSVFRDAPNLPSPHARFFRVFLFAGLFAAFFPAIFVLMTAWLPRQTEDSGGAIFVATGAVAAVGATVNFLLILVSHMNFAFSAASSSHERTFASWLIPLTQFAFATAGTAVGFSSTCARFASKMMLP